MRKINVNNITRSVSDLCVESNVKLRPDVRRAIEKSLRKESNKRAKEILRIILANADIAYQENRALCQDTGVVSVYTDIGQDVHMIGGDLNTAINKGVKEAYKNALLRKSVVKSPILRENTKTNIPAFIHTKITKGNKFKITVMPKGFGSENKSRLRMLKPTDGEEEIIDFVLETVKEAGPDACPPFILGIGIGGAFDVVSSLAKEALIYRIDKMNRKKHLRRLERSIYDSVNRMNIGPMGLGGRTTCLGVNILECPTHIAGLPIAVNVSCYITRSASKML